MSSTCISWLRTFPVCRGCFKTWFWLVFLLMDLLPRTFHFPDEWLLLSQDLPKYVLFEGFLEPPEVRSLLVLLEKSEHLISPHTTLGVLLVIVAFKKMKTKWILVLLLLLFFQNSIYVDSLLMTFLLDVGRTSTDKPIYGWVGRMSLFPLNKEQRMKGNKQS